ncbi:Gip2p NDAI_0E04350 [Naumovozyma dairenensis CBS 421]|uniref:CBM21 domain-containing protein n=1 Tax=Naumovozyma dairenensis (strain ATCC 10597 / BCRC 20456 / CBS 421 / NBRC 0211 / NRRL Y-12639) TaxID=1071378 RepID=G0WBY2_NAUDC|nr:hypothetical protein NDAI_0E04350 [Naumovozyma dairenensis CBS 421]CCD25252.1 hypothetical protein NDAI_0E04350 [Naumovozyma dairenensis CBS 421]
MYVKAENKRPSFSSLQGDMNKNKNEGSLSAIQTSISRGPPTYGKENENDSHHKNIIQDVSENMVDNSNAHAHPPSLIQQHFQKYNASQGNPTHMSDLKPPKRSPVNSLAFLHKPQRVTRMNIDKFPEEELERNTNLNKNIKSGFNENNFAEINIDDENKGNNGNDITEYSPIDFPSLSPRSTIPTNSFIRPSPPLNSDNDNPINSDEHQIPFFPVYKKSGELLKSSLKRRSKSLPSTSEILTKQKNRGNENNDDPRMMLMRSKSVHFGHKAPVKYFSKDESPISVQDRDEFEALLNFKQNANSPLAFDEEEMMSANLQKLRIGEQSMPIKSSASETKLRKSKRFQNVIKDKKNKNESSDSDNNITSSSSDLRLNDKENITRKNLAKFNEISDNLKIPKESHNVSKNIITSLPSRGGKVNLTYNKVVGLYNINFPILSNKNPKSLKLNIFIKLSKDQKCFPQEISLHIDRESRLNPYHMPFTSSSDSLNSINSVTGRSTTGKQTIQRSTRIITGKILVKNIFYDKRVVVRYTWNGWRTVHDVECIWVSDADGIVPGTNMEVFRFLIDDVSKVDSRAKLEFCIQYTTRNDHVRQEYWDNNDGKNYKVGLVLNGFNNPFAVK